MSLNRIDYDELASTYDQRYAVNKLKGIASALQSLAQKVGAERILEVGCGTGHWLAELSPFARWIHGLAIIGMQLPDDRERWYLYKYFEETYETDRRRFPSAETVLDWMHAVGFDNVEWRVAERIVNHKVGWEIFNDPFLQKHSTSQLALLTEAAYAVGLSRIKTALVDAEANGERLIFPVDVSLFISTGSKLFNG